MMIFRDITRTCIKTDFSPRGVRVSQWIHRKHNSHAPPHHNLHFKGFWTHRRDLLKYLDWLLHFLHYSFLFVFIMRFIPNMCNELNAIIEEPWQKVDTEKLWKSCGKAVEKLRGKSSNKK